MEVNCKIALVEKCGLDFYNYRLPLANYLTQRGYDVYAIIPMDENSEIVKRTGLKTLEYKLVHNSLNLRSLFNSIRQLRHYNLIYGFDVIHSFRLQPNVICNLAFLKNKKVKIVNHITGLGYSFTGSSFRAIFYRLITYFLYQLLFLRTNRIITQNPNDLNVISRLFGVKHKLLKIEGSGIDHSFYSRDAIELYKVNEIKTQINLHSDDLIITFVGRILIEKGVREFIEAAKIISKKYARIKFLLIGWLDKRNPSCLNESEMKEITGSENIFYLGKRIEVKEYLYLSNIFVLPTYREGFPRSTLEAMSMEVPVITTDVPGARQTVIHNYNGLLIKHKNTHELIHAIERLINNPKMRDKMGENGRKLVERNFCAEVIFKKFCEVYVDLMK